MKLSQSKLYTLYDSNVVTKILNSNETKRRHQNLDFGFFFFFLSSSSWSTMIAVFFFFFYCSLLREILGHIFSHSNLRHQKLGSFSMTPDFLTFKVTPNYFSGGHSCTESRELYFILKPPDVKSFPLQSKRNSVKDSLRNALGTS